MHAGMTGGLFLLIDPPCPSRPAEGFPWIRGFSSHDLLHLAQILRRDFLTQLPDNVHGLAAAVADILCLAQEGIGCSAAEVRPEFADKQKHMAYKSLDEIVDVVQESVDIIDIMKPIYNFKAAD